NVSSFSQSQESFYLCVFKMAACSEQEIDGKLSTDFCSNFPVSPVPIQNSELFIKKSRTSERILLEKVSNNEVNPDLSQLSDEQFEDILKELAQCKSAARSSSLVRCLRRGVRDREEAPPSLHGAPHRSLQDLPQCTRAAGRGRPGKPDLHFTMQYTRRNNWIMLQELISRTKMREPAVNSLIRHTGTADRAADVILVGHRVTSGGNRGVGDALEILCCRYLALKTCEADSLDDFIVADNAIRATEELNDAAIVREVGAAAGCDGKKGRNHAEETVRLARHIEGNRGDDAIDALVAFICSEDKAGKGPNGLDRKLKAAPRRARHPPRERERPFSPSFYSDQGAEPEEGPGRPDVSSYSDVDQVQEEFRLVTKKQRRRGKEALPRRPPCPAPVTPPSEPSSPSDGGGGTRPSPRPTPP
ncbi:unnamed protein product, partial [Ixodes persulcatus]